MPTPLNYCPFCGYRPERINGTVVCVHCNIEIPFKVWQRRRMPVSPAVEETIGVIKGLPRGEYALWSMIPGGDTISDHIRRAGINPSYNMCYRAICHERDCGRAALDGKVWTLL